MEEKEPSYNVGGNVSWYSHYGKHYGGSLKKNQLTYDPSILLLGNLISGKDEDSNSKRYIHPSIHCCTVYNSQVMEAM